MATADPIQQWLNRMKTPVDTYAQIKALRTSLDIHLLAQKLAPEFRDALETADAALKNLAKFF